MTLAVFGAILAGVVIAAAVIAVVEWCRSEIVPEVTKSGSARSLITMSSRYTSDGKRRSSQTHARRTHECTCGKVVAGNGGKFGHRRACDGDWLSWTEAYRASAARCRAAAEDQTP